MRYSRLAVGLLCTSALHLVSVQAKAEPPATSQSVPNPQVRNEAFFRASLVDAYDTAGTRNPKWDAEAHKVLELAVKRWVEPQVDPDIDWQIMVIGDRAYDHGCGDMAVLNQVLRAHMSLEISVKTGLIEKLSQNIADARYRPFLKLFALLHLAQLSRNQARNANNDAETRLLFNAACDNLPGLLSERDFPMGEKAQVCHDLSTLSVELGGDPGQVRQHFEDILSDALPDSPARDLYDGHMFWEAGFRSGGHAREELHQKAENAFEAALKKDPRCSEASSEMIGTLVDEGSEGSDPKLERYFQRAISDNPDCYFAYYYKGAALNTGKDGAPEQLLAFGRTCLATRRWTARIPFLLLRAQRHAAQTLYRDAAQNGDPKTATDRMIAKLYEDQPDTWRDVQSMYEGYIEYDPKAMTERVNYIQAALLAKDAGVAQKQWDELKKISERDPVFHTIVASQIQKVLPAMRKAGVK